MAASEPIIGIIERAAERLGAKRSTVLKWRQRRAVPPGWTLKFLDEGFTRAELRAYESAVRAELAAAPLAETAA